jgi:3-methylcrotonyl-CoA carboxylase beta subunit
VATLNRPKEWPVPLRKPEPPRYDASELYGIIPTDNRKPFDVREIIARLVDGSEFHEFKSRFGTHAGVRLRVHRGHADRHPSPTTASCSRSRRRRARTSSSCAASARARWCSCRTSPASWSGRKYENEGIARHGAKMVTAVATASVPKFTIIIGGSFGAGNYGMCGRAYSPRFLWMWPERAHQRDGRRAGRERAGHRASATASRPRRQWSARRSSLQAADPRPVRAQCHPYYASAGLWDDGVIDPADTRRVLALGLSAALNAPIGEPEVRAVPHVRQAP